MISLEDIYDLCPLTRDEIDAIAEHAHLPGIAAARLADYLMHAPKGPQAVQAMICDEIRAALRRDDLPHARALFAALRHYMDGHREAVRGAAP